MSKPKHKGSSKTGVPRSHSSPPSSAKAAQKSVTIANGLPSIEEKSPRGPVSGSAVPTSDSIAALNRSQSLNRYDPTTYSTGGYVPPQKYSSNKNLNKAILSYNNRLEERLSKSTEDSIDSRSTSGNHSHSPRKMMVSRSTGDLDLKDHVQRKEYSFNKPIKVERTDENAENPTIRVELPKDSRSYSSDHIRKHRTDSSRGTRSLSRKDASTTSPNPDSDSASPRREHSPKRDTSPQRDHSPKREHKREREREGSHKSKHSGSSSNIRKKDRPSREQKQSPPPAVDAPTTNGKGGGDLEQSDNGRVDQSLLMNKQDTQDQLKDTLNHRPKKPALETTLGKPEVSPSPTPSPFKTSPTQQSRLVTKDPLPSKLMKSSPGETPASKSSEEPALPEITTTFYQTPSSVGSTIQTGWAAGAQTTQIVKRPASVPEKKPLNSNLRFNPAPQAPLPESLSSSDQLIPPIQTKSLTIPEPQALLVSPRSMLSPRGYTKFVDFPTHGVVGQQVMWLIETRGIQAGTLGMAVHFEDGQLIPSALMSGVGTYQSSTVDLASLRDPYFCSTIPPKRGKYQVTITQNKKQVCDPFILRVIDPGVEIIGFTGPAAVGVELVCIWKLDGINADNVQVEFQFSRGQPFQVPLKPNPAKNGTWTSTVVPPCIGKAVLMARTPGWTVKGSPLQFTVLPIPWSKTSVQIPTTGRVRETFFFSVESPFYVPQSQIAVEIKSLEEGRKVACNIQLSSVQKESIEVRNITKRNSLSNDFERINSVKFTDEAVDTIIVSPRKPTTEGRHQLTDRSHSAGHSADHSTDRDNKPVEKSEDPLPVSPNPEKKTWDCWWVPEYRGEYSIKVMIFQQPSQTTPFIHVNIQDEWEPFYTAPGWNNFVSRGPIPISRSPNAQVEFSINWQSRSSILVPLTLQCLLISDLGDMIESVTDGFYSKIQTKSSTGAITILSDKNGLYSSRIIRFIPELLSPQTKCIPLFAHAEKRDFTHVPKIVFSLQQTDAPTSRWSLPPHHAEGFFCIGMLIQDLDGQWTLNAREEWASGRHLTDLLSNQKIQQNIRQYVPYKAPLLPYKLKKAKTLLLHPDVQELTIIRQFPSWNKAMYACIVGYSWNNNQHFVVRLNESTQGVRDENMTQIINFKKIPSHIKTLIFVLSCDGKAKNNLEGLNGNTTIYALGNTPEASRQTDLLHKVNVTKHNRNRAAKKIQSDDKQHKSVNFTPRPKSVASSRPTVNQVLKRGTTSDEDLTPRTRQLHRAFSADPGITETPLPEPPQIIEAKRGIGRRKTFDPDVLPNRSPRIMGSEPKKPHRRNHLSIQLDPITGKPPRKNLSNDLPAIQELDVPPTPHSTRSESKSPSQPPSPKPPRSHHTISNPPSPKPPRAHTGSNPPSPKPPRVHSASNPPRPTQTSPITLTPSHGTPQKTHRRDNSKDKKEIIETKGKEPVAPSATNQEQIKTEASKSSDGSSRSKGVTPLQLNFQHPTMRNTYTLATFPISDFTTNHIIEIKIFKRNPGSPWEIMPLLFGTSETLFSTGVTAVDVPRSARTMLGTDSKRDRSSRDFSKTEENFSFGPMLSESWRPIFENIQIEVLHGRNLVNPGMACNGFVTIEPDDKKNASTTNRVETQIIEDNCNPFWGQVFEFQNVKQVPVLLISCWNQFNSTPAPPLRVGTVKLKLREALSEVNNSARPIEKWLKLKTDKKTKKPAEIKVRLVGF